MDLSELSLLAKQGKPLYGETDATPYNQGVAFRNSAFSQLKLGEFNVNCLQVMAVTNLASPQVLSHGLLCHRLCIHTF